MSRVNLTWPVVRLTWELVQLPNEISATTSLVIVRRSLPCPTSAWIWFSGSQQGVHQGVGQPALVFLRRPPTLVHQHPVNIPAGEHPEDVPGGPLIKFWSQPSGVAQEMIIFSCLLWRRHSRSRSNFASSRATTPAPRSRSRGALCASWICLAMWAANRKRVSGSLALRACRTTSS
jgi:hypothetical protein